VNLSGGNQQEAILARWLAEPDLRVLLVDGADRGHRRRGQERDLFDLYDLAEKGLAIGVVSSDCRGDGICDRILVMCEGRIVKEFSRAHSNESAILAAALPVRESRRPQDFPYEIDFAA